MRVWVLTWLAACGAPVEAPEPSVAEMKAGAVVPGKEVQLQPDGPTFEARRGRPLFNSKPDHPITRIAFRRHEGRELFVDGEPLGPLPVTAPIKIGDRTFEVLIGPGDRIAFERKIVPKPGILLIELGD